LGHATFPPDAIDRQKRRLAAEIARARDAPASIANRILNVQLYGAEHPYARAATAHSIAAIERDDVVRFASAYIAPPHLALVVVGDVSRDTLLPMLERTFGSLPHAAA